MTLVGAKTVYKMAFNFVLHKTTRPKIKSCTASDLHFYLWTFKTSIEKIIYIYRKNDKESMNRSQNDFFCCFFYVSTFTAHADLQPYTYTERERIFKY